MKNQGVGGRVGVVFQAGGDLPRAEVITELLNNLIGPNTTAVGAAGKLSATWAEIKQH